MPDPTWTAVDAYYSKVLFPSDAALDAALADSEAAGLPPISVTPHQGRLLQLLATMSGAKRVLEVGTLGGYSTISLARAVGEAGHVVTLEYEAKHAAVAMKNFGRAGLTSRIDLRLGPAKQTLAAMVAEGVKPFDFVFIDADKSETADYFARAMELTRPGAIIFVDNVVRNGAVADAASTDASVLGIRRFNDMLANEKRVTATTMQTVGAKGYDGFTLIRVHG